MQCRLSELETRIAPAALRMPLLRSQDRSWLGLPERQDIVDLQSGPFDRSYESCFNGPVRSDQFMSLRLINFNGPKSIRSQLRAILLQEITAGVYQKDQRFPAERTLAARFGISRASVRETIAELISEGVLF